MSELVRYQVMAKCFVNNELLEPKGRDGKPTFVMAPPGLDSPVLKLAAPADAVPASQPPAGPVPGPATDHAAALAAMQAELQAIKAEAQAMREAAAEAGKHLEAAVAARDQLQSALDGVIAERNAAKAEAEAAVALLAEAQQASTDPAPATPPRTKK